jgi:geranylgeranyl diphosphate synthase type I
MENNKKEKIEIIFQKWANLVDPKIKEILNLSVDKKTQKLVNYQIAVGGKRLRPALTIASCLACGGKIEDALYPAAGLEILHNCTLIYDDIIDNSNLRRGEPTTWFKFGKSIAECVGIDYAAAIFQAANKSKYSLEISEIFARTMKKIVEGEILDILFEQSGREDEKYIIENRYNGITEKDYLKMVSKKTASLIQACCEAGAISAKSKKSEIDALKNYGFNLGIVFQIRDDVLDIFGEEKEFGKKIGKDIEERKLGNIIVFYALKELSQKQKERFLVILRKNKIKNKDIKEALKLISKTKAKEKSFLLGEKYIKKAKENLKSLSQNDWNKFLAEIADFTIKRVK